MKPEIRQDMIEYFRSRGFDNPIYSSDGGLQVWGNTSTGVTVVLNFEAETATFKTVNRMVTSILGPFSVPNKHIKMFLAQIESHAEKNS